MHCGVAYERVCSVVRNESHWEFVIHCLTFTPPQLFESKRYRQSSSQEPFLKENPYPPPPENNRSLPKIVLKITGS